MRSLPRSGEDSFSSPESPLVVNFLTVPFVLTRAGGVNYGKNDGLGDLNQFIWLERSNRSARRLVRAAFHEVDEASL